MKLQKLALTALALSMGTAFAAGNTDKRAESSPSNQASMAQSAPANQPSSSTSSQSASSSANQAASTNGSQSGMSSSSAQADPQVRQVQQALKDQGHDPGAIDGIMGPQTKQALQGFQQAKGISGAGELDQQTLAALGVQGDSLASNTSQPSNAGSSAASGADQASSGNQASSSSTTQGYTKQ